MTRAPLVTAKPEAPFARGERPLYDTTLGWRFVNPPYEELYSTASMGETGENVADRWGVSRADQDALALRSQERWAAAAAAGRFDDELVPAGELTRDEHPRPDTTLEKLGALRPAFRESGTVTAGNASGINDGTAALVIANESRAEALGIEPLGVFSGSAVAGVDPAVMGSGPVPAVRKLLDRAGLTIEDVESRRAQRGICLAVTRGLPRARPRRDGRQRQRRRHRPRPPARDERPGSSSRCSTSSDAVRAGTGWRRSAWGWGRARRRCSSVPPDPGR